MNTTKDGGSAFPYPMARATSNPRIHDYVKVSHGMTLRDYFAGQALAGLAALGFLGEYTSSEIAAVAYKRADAMIAVREGK